MESPSSPTPSLSVSDAQPVPAVFDWPAVESLLLAARAEVQRLTGQDYCAVGVEGSGLFRIYVHEGGMHDGPLADVAASAAASAAPRARALALRMRLEAMSAEVARLESLP